VLAMKLYLMQLGALPLDLPVPGYLVQTNDSTNVLIDTGVPKSHIGAYREASEPTWKMDEEDYVVRQLGRIGVAPGDVRYVVSTHYDGDHCGNHEDFPSAEFVVQRALHEIAMQGAERFSSMRDHWGASGLRVRLVDGDTELLPGIELIESGGHVPGHQSVLVRLPKTGPVLLAVDAIPFTSHLDPDTREITPFDADEAGVRASTRKLVELARREGAMIVHGHDSAQWATLKRLPESYD
jgi:N-acyl homoserine lactone hydrolase